MMRKIIFILLILTIFIIVWINKIIDDNKNYLEDDKEKLINNKKIEINYFNKYDDFYIVETDDSFVVFDSGYEEICREDLNNIIYPFENYEVIYDGNNILYLEKRKENNKIIFIYYDIMSLDEINRYTL